MSRQQGKAGAWFPRVRNALCEAGSIFVFRQPKKRRNKKKLRGVGGFCAFVKLLALGGAGSIFVFRQPGV
jgi:hypothetical protein